MQIMIAQYRHCLLAQTADKAERFQRMRSPINQIASQPVTRAWRLALNALNQRLQWLETPLNITDCVHAHLLPIT